MCLFTFGLMWLLTALVFELVNAVQLLRPGFMAECPVFTYGRVAPAARQALLFGFAVQAGLGMMVWMMARMNRRALAHAGVITVGVLFWNVGLKIGFLGLLLGHSTGFPGLELPAYSAILLLVSYLLIAVPLLLDFHSRAQRDVYVSQYFLLAALIVFPGIYGTAQVLLILDPVPGAIQALVYGWYDRMFYTLWLTPVALAAALYFIPKLVDRPLHSHQIGVFGFWSLAVVGGWSGISLGAPFPAWLVSLSAVATVMLIIPAVCAYVNLCKTASGRLGLFRTDPVLRYLGVSLAAFGLVTLYDVLSVREGFAAITELTFVDAAWNMLVRYGFVGMSLFAAIHFIVPRLSQIGWLSDTLAKIHLFGTITALAVGIGGLAIGGILQGLIMSVPEAPFANATRFSHPFLYLNVVGIGLLIVAQLPLLLNFLGQLIICCSTCCLPDEVEVETTTTNTEAVGANA